MNHPLIVIGIACLMSSNASFANHEDDPPAVAQVKSVEPVTKVITTRTPYEECWEEEVSVVDRRYGRRGGGHGGGHYHSGTTSLIGALIGGGGSTLGRDVRLPIRPHRFPPHRGGDVPPTQTVRIGVDRGFFAFEPHANLRLSIKDWLRASLGASYRFVGWAGDDFNEALRGPTATFSLQFGVF